MTRKRKKQTKHGSFSSALDAMLSPVTPASTCQASSSKYSLFRRSCLMASSDAERTSFKSPNVCDKVLSYLPIVVMFPDPYMSQPFAKSSVVHLRPDRVILAGVARTTVFSNVQILHLKEWVNAEARRRVIKVEFAKAWLALSPTIIYDMLVSPKFPSGKNASYHIQIAF